MQRETSSERTCIKKKKGADAFACPLSSCYLPKISVLTCLVFYYDFTFSQPCAMQTKYYTLIWSYGAKLCQEHKYVN